MVDVVPELAAEMERELRASGDDELADQVAGLRMMKSCGCGDDFCASFDTVSVPEGPSAKQRYGVPLSDHHLIVHVMEGQIIEVEVLFRDDLRPKIREVFGDEADWRLREKQADQN
ncbi:MAG: hypothetical protein ACLGIB_01705 [Actinomycetota bacterium]